MNGYAVVDVETTGFSAAKHDRIVEVAVVQVDGAGNVEGEWTTLVNPLRDVGPQHIHRISAAEVLRAPTFDAVAPHLAAQLTGRVLVGHNLVFDGMFLSAEFTRAGLPAPIDHQHGVCTMKLASHFLPSQPRNLAACCTAAGVSQRDAHSALGDAQATAELFAWYISMADVPPPWRDVFAHASSAQWPAFAGLSEFLPALRGAAAHRPGQWLERLVPRLPRVPHPRTADAYLAVLDTALVDRQLSLSEQDALVDLAVALSLSRVDVEKLHADYLRALAAAAWQDGVITAEEHQDLNQVAHMLGLAERDVDSALTAAQDGVGSVLAPRPSFELAVADEVVFTGSMNVSRETWISRARAAGLIAGEGSVTKRTRLLVAADPDSMSGKARKARACGIPIVGEVAFERMLGSLQPYGEAAA